MDLTKIFELFSLLESEFPCGSRGRHSITYRGNLNQLELDVWLNDTDGMRFYKLDDNNELNDPIKLVKDIKLLEGIK